MIKNGQKVALVTGATRGIGLETARQLASRGVHVFLGARDPAVGAARAAECCAAGLEVEPLELDLSKVNTIARAARVIDARYGGLDILINNAGIFMGQADTYPSAADPEAIRRTIDLNFIATVVVTQYMLPLIRRSSCARIVNVSSTVGSLNANGDPTNGSPRWLGYAASKAALNLLTIQLAYELRDTPIKVNSVCPGYVKTDMNHGQGFVTSEEGAQIAVRFALLDEDGPSGGFFAADGPRAW